MKKQCIKKLFNQNRDFLKYFLKTSPKKHAREFGFSLAELSAALAFVAFIMVFLFTVMINILNTYNKGIWLSQINQAGRQISADFSDQARYSADKIDYIEEKNRLCINGVSYVWNKGGDVKNKFENDAPIGLVRIEDRSGEYCTSRKNDKITRDNSVKNLLGFGAMIQEFNVSYNRDSALYRIEAVFSTAGNNQPEKKDGVWTCLDSVGFNQYCAFMNLDITVFRRGEK